MAGAVQPHETMTREVLMGTRRRRGEIGSIASGVLHSFASRNNDINGYWGLGVLFLYAQQMNEFNVKVDILRALVHPPVACLPPSCRMPHFEVVIERYKSMLSAIMMKRNIPEEWVSEAVISIEFRSRFAAPAYPRIGEDSAPFICRLTIKDDLGKERVYRTDGWCWPHDPRRECQRAEL